MSASAKSVCTCCRGRDGEAATLAGGGKVATASRGGLSRALSSRSRGVKASRARGRPHAIGAPGHSTIASDGNGTRGRNGRWAAGTARAAHKDGSAAARAARGGEAERGGETEREALRLLARRTPFGGEAEATGQAEAGGCAPISLSRLLPAAR